MEYRATSLRVLIKMKIYLRILEYAPGLVGRLIKFFLYSLLGVAFSAAYLGLIMPMMKVLFDKSVTNVVPPLQKFSISIDFADSFLRHHFIKLIVEQGRMGALLWVCVGIVLCVMVSNSFRYLERMTASRLKVDVVKNMRMHIFNSIMSLHIGYFNDQRKGDLMSRFTNDMAEVENSVINSLKSVLKEPVTIIVYLIVLFTISVKLTLFTLILLPITGGVIGQIIKRLKRKAKQSQESMGRIVNILDETFSAMRVIKAFNARNFIVKKIDDETSYHRKVNLSISRKNELSSPVSEFLGVIIVAIIMYYGG